MSVVARLEHCSINGVEPYDADALDLTEVGATNWDDGAGSPGVMISCGQNELAVYGLCHHADAMCVCGELVLQDATDMSTDGTIATKRVNGTIAGMQTAIDAIEALVIEPQAANLVLAGPASGDPAAPTMRALVPADLPDTDDVPTVAQLTADGWAWDNQGGSTMADGDHGIAIYFPPSTTTNFRNLVMAAPVAPYQLTIGLVMTCLRGNYHCVGIGWKEALGGAAKLELNTLDLRNANAVRYMHLVTETGAVAAEGNQFINSYTNRIYLRARDDGTNIKCYASFDGDNWIQIDDHTYAAGYLGVGGYDYLAIVGNAENATEETRLGVFFYELEEL